MTEERELIDRLPRGLRSYTHVEHSVFVPHSNHELCYRVIYVSDFLYWYEKNGVVR